MPMPPPEPDGFVKTLNRMGYMTSALDPCSAEFVRSAARATRPVADLGAAYGVATLAALEAGARVIANDLDERHLAILLERAPEDLRPRLELKPGALPDGVDLGWNALDAALACRVLHFLDGAAIERAAKALYKWLAPGGKAFVVAETPYVGTFRSFIPEYEARKKAGDPWPGFVPEVAKICPPERAAMLPPWINFLDPEILTRVFEGAGFVVESAATMARPDFPKQVQLDGRESAALVARKP